jgi:mRNA-degrading endonuclease RelE of RelBE toxin-antitoxin system
MKFAIKYTDDALDDLPSLRKYDQVIILDQVERQLSHEALVETRNRKRLRPNRVAEWEVRIAHFRVFYDVQPKDQLVKVVAVGYKKGSRLILRGEEFEL